MNSIIYLRPYLATTEQRRVCRATLILVLILIAVHILSLNAAQANEAEGAEELGTMERMFRRGLTETGITVRTEQAAEADIRGLLQRGMTPKQVSSLLGRPARVMTPSGGTGPPVFPIAWDDALEEWWIYPRFQTKDGRHLQLLFANRIDKKEKTLFSVWLWPNEAEPQQRDAGAIKGADGGSAPFGGVVAAVEQVVVEYLEPERGRFSITVRRSGGQLEEGDHPLLKEWEDRLENRMPNRWKEYVPASKLRFPTAGEKDPKDPDGKTLRGIEDETGSRIKVFRIKGIDVISSNEIRVHWDYGSGPMAGVGGTYRVSRDADEWSIEPVGASYDH